jgi:hypothetical protein
MNLKYRHPDKLIIQIIPEYFDRLIDDGEHASTSFEEMREIIFKEFDRVLWPWQLGLFISGVLVSIATISFTHFFDKKPEIVNAQPKQDDDGTKKAYDPDPTGDY